MSNETIIALAAVVLSGVTTLANLGFNLWNSSSERQTRLAERHDDYREWYRRTLFEKRLAAIQEEHSWLMKLNAAMNGAETDTPDSPENERLRQISVEARAWYDGNALFLNDGLPTSSEFVGLTNGAYAYASGQKVLDVWKSFIEADKINRARADRLLEAELDR